MAKISAPAFESDQPATIDAFGRKAFAGALARSLCLPAHAPGLIVGLEGEWGVGKSTLINFVKAALAGGDQKVLLVEFNPWLTSGSDGLVDVLLSQLASAVGQTSTLAQAEVGINAGQKLLSYVALLRHLKYLKYVPGLGWAGTLMEDAGDAAVDAAVEGSSAGTEALRDIEKLLPNLDIGRRKEEVVAALTELDLSIVVVVDDIDRLVRDEIRTLFQAIKAVADFPRVTYLLAYDRAVVARALGDAAHATDGAAYLEKIVQVAYPLPPLFRWQLRQFCETRLKDLLSGLRISLRDYERQRWDGVLSIIAKLSRHPRDVVRLANRLTLSLPATAGEVNVCDVVVFEGLSQRFPSLRDAFRDFPEDFTGEHFGGDVVRSSDDWRQYIGDGDKDRGRWKAHLPQDGSDRSTAAAACEFLFPRLVEHSPESSALDELRVSASDRLIRLFALTAIEGVASASEIHSILRNPKHLADVLDSPKNEALQLLGWCAEYLGSAEVTDPDGLVGVLIDWAAKVLEPDEFGEQVAVGVARLIARIIEISKDLSIPVFHRVVAEAPLSVGHDILLRAATEQGKWSMRPNHEVSVDEQLVPDGGAVDAAIAVWCDRAGKAAVEGKLHREARLQAVLFRWAQLGQNRAKVVSAIEIMCQSPEGLNAFAKGYFETGANSLGDFSLIWDSAALADRIEAEESLRERCLTYCSQLRSQPVIEYLAKQSDVVIDEKE